MQVHDSARKHGIAESDAMAVAERPVATEVVGEDPDRELRIGFTPSGDLLEVVVLRTYDGEDLLIHAMPCRAQYLRLLTGR